MAIANGNAITGRITVKDGLLVWPAQEKVNFDKEVRLRHYEDGLSLVFRVEPEDEAWRYSDLKFYFGYLVTPFCQATGYTKTDAHGELFKPMFMPDGKTSLLHLSREEMRAYCEDVEQFIRQELPDIVLPQWQEG